MSIQQQPTKAFGVAYVQEGVFVESNIDLENGKVHNVAILGMTSTNGRQYTPKALASAVTQFEGKPAYYHHKDRWERNIKNDLIGYFSDLRVDGNTVKGTLNVMESERERLFYIAKHMSTRYGFSIDATTKYYINSGVEYIDEIIDAKSVDLVDKPATVKGVFEQEEHSMESNPELQEKDLQEQLTNTTKSLQEQMELIVAKDAQIKSLTEELHKSYVDITVLKHGVQIPEATRKVLHGLPKAEVDTIIGDIKKVYEQALPTQGGSMPKFLGGTISAEDLKKDFTRS